MPYAEFQKIISTIVKRDTSDDPENWTEYNPLLGHCAVVALLAQDLFGGEILRASLEDTEFFVSRSHYWNLLVVGERDFTKNQFGGKLLKLCGEITVRSKVLSNYNTRIRYGKLAARMYNFLKLNT